VPVVAQVDEGVHSLLLEDQVVSRILSTHAPDHWLVDTDWRHVDILLGRLLTKDKAEIKMEELAIIADHEVLQMAITQSEQVSSSGVGCIRKQVVFVNFLSSLLVSIGFLFEELAQIFVVLQTRLLNGLGVFDELHNSIIFTAGQALEASEGQVDIDLPEQLVKKS